MFRTSKTVRLFWIIGVLSLVFVIAAPVFAGEFVPLKGRFEGVGANFGGNLTHLGRFTGVIDLVAGTAVWTAANGDTVTNQTTSFVIDFSHPVSANVFPYTQTIVITGGTGRFAHAQGSATITGLFNVVTNAYDGDIDGRITKPNH